MQGFNMGRYVPPELEGTTTGNKIHKKKAPGMHGGAMTVRFEMPFNIFCGECEGHIAQGVRFNADKKKVGNYYSTPIFAFRMKHIACGNTIEIRTDPKNTAYEVTEGGKKQATAEAGANGIVAMKDPLKAEEVLDPFAKAEKAVEDKQVATTMATRLEEIQKLNDKQWEDPYEHSKKMRKIFREERKRIESKDKATEAIRDRNALHITLLDEAPEDSIMAKLVEFGPGAEEAESGIPNRPLFDSEKNPARKGPKKRSRPDKPDPSDLLAETLRTNTRMRIDPFIQASSHFSQKPAFPLRNPSLARKVKAGDVEVSKPSTGDTAASPKASSAAGLVEYGSDSD